MVDFWIGEVRDVAPYLQMPMFRLENFWHGITKYNINTVDEFKHYIRPGFLTTISWGSADPLFHTEN